MQDKKFYSFIFISIIALVSAGLLSFAVMFLRPLQERNEAVEKKKNILLAVGLVYENNTPGPDEILQMFEGAIEPIVVNQLGEKVESGLNVEKINPELEENKPPDQQCLPLFLQKEKGQVVSYCLPVFGKGLWSTIYGYLALEKDRNTIKGITFYKNGETPGLGAEITQTWFTGNFRGKQIFDNTGNLVSVRVVKGKVDPASPGLIHEVDGISGATKTCEGINSFLLKDLAKYQVFLQKQRD
ncbi:MAG: NADH:ubiquinone reductase (Na(+)-transporting) subunit C [Candidatus Marinimicrobia bacterium]|nr:NADH:ubiquinone reductase (Na(+)-transporting) subunit C [Candidatus Neomarinimicrobiota bacterium]